MDEDTLQGFTLGCAVVLTLLVALYSAILVRIASTKAIGLPSPVVLVLAALMVVLSIWAIAAIVWRWARGRGGDEEAG